LDILQIADIIGIISFALSGVLIAVRQNLDILGIFLSSFLTALGGGIIRDTIVDKIPYSLENTLPALIVIVTIASTFLFKLYKKDNLDRKTIFIISDSIGLVSFSITGALIAIEAGLNYFGVTLLALITAVGGGSIRDSLINSVPFVLTSEFYGSVSVIIATLIYLLHFFALDENIYIIFVFIIGIVIRLMAYYKSWKLPKLNR